MSMPLDVLPGLTPGIGYRAHSLHGPERIWVEKNCYVDICIEVIHALGHEPLAMLGSTLAIDFDGDQFTFYKPAHRDLVELYGLDIQELNVWRELLDHVTDHLAAGRLVSTETDAFWLPDTAGTDYRHQHTKTTVVISAVDPDARRARYFHNGGFHELEGEDYQALFRPRAELPGGLPLYAEVFRADRVGPRSARAQMDRALSLLRSALALTPPDDPIARFGERLAAGGTGPASQGLEWFHLWAFATIRQLGACAELSAAHLAWLTGQGLTGLQVAEREFKELAQQARTLMLKGARSAATGRALDATAQINALTASRRTALDSLRSHPLLGAA